MTAFKETISYIAQKIAEVRYADQVFLGDFNLDHSSQGTHVSCLQTSLKRMI